MAPITYGWLAKIINNRNYNPKGVGEKRHQPLQTGMEAVIARSYVL